MGENQYEVHFTDFGCGVGGLECNPLVVAVGVFKLQAVAPQSVDHLATAVDEPDVMARGCQPTAKDTTHSPRANDRDFHA
jgi:hypothetical protein